MYSTEHADPSLSELGKWGCIGSGDDEREEETNASRWPLRAYTVERQCVMAGKNDSANAVVSAVIQVAMRLTQAKSLCQSWRVAVRLCQFCLAQNGYAVSAVL